MMSSSTWGGARETVLEITVFRVAGSPHSTPIYPPVPMLAPMQLGFYRFLFGLGTGR